MAANATEISSPALQVATKNSTTVWQDDLQSLFHRAKDRFPDVVWELSGIDEDGEEKEYEEVWGHKAIVYARAPPSFQTRYFSFRPNGATPYPSSPVGTLPMTSVLSLDIPPSISRTPSPYRSSSPAPSAPMPGTLLRLSTSISPALFSNELEYLYTGQGFGEAFEFLFDAPESKHDGLDAEELRIDKLRKDLVFMWRSRLYSDVRIALTGYFSSSNHENTTAIFSSHRFILVSRSSYFHNALIGWPHKSNPSNEPVTLTLPSPPFTPASLHFTLGFIYTGTLVFSHRSYDLDTAFHILTSATYLSLQSLYDEIQARIIQEMMHGLFHAFLPFSEYEALTSGSWGTSGCRCRQCARRAPRVLEFSLRDDVKNGLLERGARRALVGLFGEGWCTSEFASLPIKIRESLLKGVGKRTIPENALALLFAAEHALGRISAVIDAWASEVREMILVGRRGIDEVICGKSEACFNGHAWSEIMERDGVAFEDAERVEWVMASISRGVNEKNAAILYQTLVSSILLRPHPTETNAPMLSSTSHIRVQVEQTRMDVLRWIGKRWIGIRQEGGFDDLEGWAIKEISDNIEVPLEDLITPTPPSHAKPHRPNTLLRPKDADSNNDSISMHSSMRVSVLSRNLPPVNTRRGTTPTLTTGASSSAASFKSLTRSNGTRSPTRSFTARGGARRRNGAPVNNEEGEEQEQEQEEDPDAEKASLRPDSKLTPGLSSIDLPPYSSRPNSGNRSTSPTQQLSVIESSQGEGSPTGEYDDEGDRDSTRDSMMDAEEGTPPDSPSLSVGPSIISHTTGGSENTTPLPLKKTLIKKISPATTPSIPGTSRNPAGSLRQVSSSSSIRSSTASFRSTTSSIRSHASTIRKTSAGGTSITGAVRRPSETPSGKSSRTTSRALSASTSSSRPISNLSTTSDGSTTFLTANSSVGAPGGSTERSRRASNASTVSNVSTRGAASTSTGIGERAAPARPGATTARPRKSSTGSAKSGVSVTPNKRPPLPPLAPKKLSPTSTKRPGSTASSIRSTTSTMSTATSAAVRKASIPIIGRRPGVIPEKEKEQEMGENDPTQTVPQPISSTSSLDSSSKATNNNNTNKGKSKAAAPDHKKTESTASTASNSTLKRRGSTDTITTKTSVGAPSSSSNATTQKARADATPLAKKKSTSQPVPKEERALPSLPFTPRGATLEIGIPCIIASKRKRFKAYARYIGEVEGELGPWVGVEVPVGESWGADRDADGDRQWNDGTWGGIRYFDIGNTAESEWEYNGDDRATRRRRTDGSSSTLGGKGMLKREGDQLNVERVKRFRSVSPAISDASGTESRGLFVRPQQVLYVVDAVGSDL